MNKLNEYRYVHLIYHRRYDVKAMFLERTNKCDPAGGPDLLTAPPIKLSPVHDPLGCAFIPAKDLIAKGEA